MLRETFAGRNPTHFIGNPIVKSFILSEIFLWSSWFSILPLLSVFVVNDVSGGNLQLAASGYSLYLIARVISELISGRFMSHSSDKAKIYVSIFGLLMGGLGTLGVAFVDSVGMLFVSLIVIGLGIGVASPPKNSLFSSHLDKNKETTEWGLYDAVVFICIALSTALGGFLATEHGFRVFFIVAAIWMLFSIVPYILYLRGNHTVSSSI